MSLIPSAAAPFSERVAHIRLPLANVGERAGGPFKPSFGLSGAVDLVLRPSLFLKAGGPGLALFQLWGFSRACGDGWLIPLWPACVTSPTGTKR
jgi:hypothetical protein